MDLDEEVNEGVGNGGWARCVPLVAFHQCFAIFLSSSTLCYLTMLNFRYSLPADPAHALSTSLRFCYTSVSYLLYAVNYLPCFAIFPLRLCLIATSNIIFFFLSATPSLRRHVGTHSFPPSAQRAQLPVCLPAGSVTACSVRQTQRKQPARHASATSISTSAHLTMQSSRGSVSRIQMPSLSS
ncbi:hypothetical protein V8E53_002915 [Lactarius tabidus]